MDTKQEIVRREASGNKIATLFPPVDVIEDDNGITLTAELPGATKENLAIGVDADMLIIEGAVTLGPELDATQIAAAIKDSVLMLHAPKLEHTKPRRMAVKVD